MGGGHGRALTCAAPRGRQGCAQSVKVRELVGLRVKPPDHCGGTGVRKYAQLPQGRPPALPASGIGTGAPHPVPTQYLQCH